MAEDDTKPPPTTKGDYIAMAAIVTLAIMASICFYGHFLWEGETELVGFGVVLLSCALVAFGILILLRCDPAKARRRKGYIAIVLTLAAIFALFIEFWDYVKVGLVIVLSLSLLVVGISLVCAVLALSWEHIKFTISHPRRVAKPKKTEADPDSRANGSRPLIKTSHLVILCVACLVGIWIIVGRPGTSGGCTGPSGAVSRSKVKYSWHIDYGVFNDDVALTNTSGFTITNVEVKIYIVKNGRQWDPITLVAPGIYDGQEYRWTNAFSVPGSPADSAKAFLRCDQSR